MPSPTDSETSPGFSPTLELPGPPGHKSTDAEDDEGIHSNDGGSDISDSASEGSYDSGLNGLAAATEGGEKLPETPTEELPSPTKLLSHTCIFCDRTFSLEMDYRRHLNRHLVNVYYLKGAAQGDKWGVSCMEKGSIFVSKTVNEVLLDFGLNKTCSSCNKNKVLVVLDGFTAHDRWPHLCLFLVCNDATWYIKIIQYSFNSVIKSIVSLS